MRRMVQGVQDAASAEEEQSLEEGVREEVKHAGAGAIGCAGHTQTNEHVAQLADRREGQHALEIVLREGDQRGEDGGDAAHPGHNEKCRRASRREEREGTRYHVDASRDHRGGVDQRADGRRAFHRGRQPDMQRDLGGFANRAAEDEDHCQRQQTLIHVRHARRQLVEIEGSGVGEQDHDADDEADVAYARGDEGFYRGGSRRKAILFRLGALVDPEADQQVRTQAHQFPADEHHQEVLREGDDEHREGEEREVGEETRVPRRVVHIPLRVELHQQGNGRDHHHHHNRQIIDAKSDQVTGGRALVQPGVGEDANTACWQRRRNIDHARRVEKQQPRVDAGQRHDEDADIAAPFRAGRQRWQLGIIVILLHTLVRALFVASVGSAMRSGFMLAMSAARGGGGGTGATE